MRRIQNTKNGRTALITDEYKKGNVVVNYELTYEDDGSTTNLSPSTVRRWWKDIGPAEQDTVTLAVEVEADTKDAEVAGDGTPYSQVMAEILEDEKAAVKKKASLDTDTPAPAVDVKVDKKKTKKPMATANADVEGILAYIDKAANKVGMQYYVRDKQPNHRNYKPEGGKVLFTVHVSKASAEMYLKASQIPETVSQELEVLNGFFNRRLVITELTDDKKSVIDTIIKNF